MAILTKPAVTKGAAASFTLTKADLAAVSSVAADTYYSDVSNWKLVRMMYRSVEGNQREVVLFDVSQVGATAAGQFSVSDKARNLFEIAKIVIEDFDGGMFQVERAELADPETNFDISLDSIPPSAFLPFTRTFDSAQGSIDTSEYYEEIQVEGGSANIDLITNSLVISITDTTDFLNGFIWSIGSGQATTLHNMTGNVVVEVDYNNSSHQVGFKAVSFSSGGFNASSATVETDDTSGQGTLQLILVIDDVLSTSVTDFSVQLVDSFSNFPLEEEFTINITEIRIIAQA
jgi:hypothetical protein